MRLAPDNAADLVCRYDIVVDGSDNFDTRYLLADTCLAAKAAAGFGSAGAV